MKTTIKITEGTKTLNIYDLIKDIKNGMRTEAEYLTDYDSGYICDAISELAENKTIYGHSCLAWLNNENDASDYMEEAIACVDVKSYNFYNHLRIAYFLWLENQMNGELDEALTAVAFNYIKNDLELEYIPEDIAEEVKNLNFSEFEKFEDIFEAVNDLFDEEED